MPIWQGDFLCIFLRERFLSQTSRDCLISPLFDHKGAKARRKKLGDLVVKLLNSLKIQLTRDDQRCFGKKSLQTPVHLSSSLV
jgi:hypothetical protein